MESLEPRWVLDSVVVFNEVMYHPADADMRGEWIELRNLLSIDLDLSDWTLASGVEYRFPVGTTIPADGYLVVAAQPDKWAGSAVEPVLGPWSGSLANQGERIELRNNSDRIMDQLEYGDDGEWPVAADGAGPSLAKQNAYWTSRDAKNWSYSYASRGTPGLDNRPTVDTTPRTASLVSLPARWRYSPINQDLGTAWREPAFNDAAWFEGNATFYAGIQTATESEVRVAALDPNGDADISAGATYTHRLDFGNADSGAQVNGVPFTRVASTDLLTSTDFSWSNATGIRSQGRATGVAALSGPLREIYQDYVANTLNTADSPVQLTLLHLTPGTRYLTRLFARRNSETTRNTTLEFASGTDSKTITLDQSSPGFADPELPYVVEFEFTAQTDRLVITATQHDATRPWLWFGLTNEVVTLTGNTELPAGVSTQYLRHAFTYQGDSNADRELQMRLLADDGAVVYLNGTEIHRVNLPPGPVSFATPALSDTSTNRLSVPFSLPADALRDGVNVLGVELHRATAESDMRFGAELNVIETPRPLTVPPRIELNELPAAETPNAWVEIANRDDVEIESSDLRLEIQGAANRVVPLPAMTLAPGALWTVPVSESWEDGARVVLYQSGNDQVLDAQRIAESAQARSTANDSRWLRPAHVTPGSVNQFAIEDAIVINEIMYHAPPTYGDGDRPFAESGEEWIELYNRSQRGVDLSGWSLTGGISFLFPDCTVLPADGYLVITRNLLELQAKWPTIQALGDFSGSLANSGELIVLRDAFQNPVDEVHYYDSGAWNDLADGNGASLELIDPLADNNVGDVWAPSDIREAPWVTVTYEGAARSPQGSQDPTEWNEFILGMLSAGEILLDDVSVIEDPQGTAVERMQNGGFEEHDDHWRMMGDHGQHGLTRVIADPDNPANHVLHLVAHGATEHMSNHIETTFLDNARIQSSTTYRISFKAKWLSGSPQVHTRLYFNRLAKTTILPMTELWGSPGAPNSHQRVNAGPTFAELIHTPAVPVSGEPVVVSVRAADPQGVTELILNYRRDGQTWQTVAMQHQGGDRYAAQLPGAPANALIQFYVSGRDSAGAISQFPAAGVDSRALYRVQERNPDTSSRHSLRILMSQDDLAEMFTNVNYTSNERHGATVIWRNSEVYYDVDVRLKGSGFSRGSGVTGFNLSFSSDRLLFGEHATVSVDRQGGPWGPGASQRELAIKYIANRAGDIPMMYDDVITLMGPKDTTPISAQFLVARYDDVFFDSQYENGADGTRFKFELIYYSTLTVDGTVEGLKLPPSSQRQGVFPVRGVDMPYMGEDPNAYRWHYLIRNQRDRDDYSRIVALTDALRLSGSTVGSELDLKTQEVMDVDQWMRLFAFESLAGINDTFNQGLQHNLQLYVRPSDQRVLALPWDMDFALHQDTSMSIYGTGSRLTRVINIPTNRRVFQQHLWDIMQTSYRTDYLEPWLKHWADVTGQDATAAILSYVNARRNFVSRRLAPQVDFAITTENKDQLTVDTATVVLDGRGWIDVREIYRAGQSAPLTVRWLDSERWQVEVPLQPGENHVELEARDLRGNPVGAASARVTSNLANPLVEGLRVSELNYHPADPTSAERAAGWTDAEAFEYVELVNIAAVPLHLAGAQFVSQLPDGSRSGIDFVFPAHTLAPGETVIVAKDPTAFATRYGVEKQVLGSYSGQLANGGETLSLVTAAGEVIQRFTYDDDWYSDTDGQGSTLEVRSPDTADVSDWNVARTWQSSRALGGSPHFAALPDFDGNGVLNVDDIDQLCAAIASDNLRYDLDNNQSIDHRDLEILVLDKLQTRIGDVNLDGRFGTQDLVLLFLRGEYEDGITGNSTYSDGDWNCDGDFTSADLVFALLQGPFETGFAAGGGERTTPMRWTENGLSIKIFAS